MKISEGKGLKSASWLCDELGVSGDLRKDVLASIHHLYGDGHVHGSQVATTIACLLTILQIERSWDEHGTPEAKEYMRLRNIMHETMIHYLKPEGHAAAFGGEPEFYGIINALVVKLLQVYGKNEPETKA